MPTQAIAGTAAGGSNASLAEVLAPIYVSGDAEAGSGALLWLGPASRIYGAAQAGSSAALALTVAVGLYGEAPGGSDAVLYGLGTVRVIAGAAAAGSSAALASLSTGGAVLAGDAPGGSAAGLALTVGQGIAGAAAAGSGAEMQLMGALPTVRDPLPGEAPGTVNLVRNPSLEYAAWGLDGWRGAGHDLGRVEDGTAWSGAAHAAAVGNGYVVVSSLDGLGATGARSWVASVSLRGAAAEVWVEATYDDGATAYPDTVALPASEGWARATTEALATDPGKVVRLVELWVYADGAIDLDGAQIEEDRGQRGTPYADGDAGAGHRWLGVPGNSPSVREPGADGGGG